MPNEILLVTKDNRDPLNAIDLSPETQDRLLAETIGETAVSFIPIFDKLVNFASSYKNKLDAARLALLLQDFKEKINNLEKFQEILSKLLATSTGLIIFQKVIRISSAGVFEREHIKILANVLKKITDTDFETLFEEHNYVLSQIEKLTPQALLLLSNKADWPLIQFPSTTTSGVTTGKGWDIAFARAYAKKRGVGDNKTLARICHVLHELENINLTLLEKNSIELTSVGQEVYSYLI